MSKYHLLIVGLLATTAITSTANAQSSGAPMPQAGGANGPTSQTSPSSGVQQVPGRLSDPVASASDIIVTAQRRGQNLQDVPITITAVNAQTLQSAGVSSTVDLPAVTPGLIMASSRNGVTPYLRGIGTQAGTSEQAVAVYIDNVYIASSAASAFSLNNVQRIEVLKGPQGTLFGRNATGGLINVITRDPSHTPELDVSAGYGNYNTYTGSLYATAGLTDNIAMDFAAYGNYQKDGWGRNTYLNEDVNLSRSLALRSKIKGEFGKTSVTLAGDYNLSANDYGNARATVGGTVTQGGFLSPPNFYDTVSSVTSNVNRKTNQWGGSLRIDQELSESFSLTNTVAYRKNHYPSCTDSDLTPIVRVDGCFVENSNTFQEELLLNGKVGRLQMTGGLFYYHYNRGLQPLVVNSIVPALRSYRYTDVVSDSYAAFGQLTYALTDSTNLTGGLRYTTEDVKANGQIRAGTTATSPLIFDTATRTDGISNKTNAKKLTWRFSIDHRFSPDFMIYASANRGFKSGTYNVFAISDVPTQPETLDAYEVGFKSELFDGQLRLNGAAFYYDYRGIQVSTVLLIGTGDRNAASGRVKGLEGEFVFAPHVSVGRFEIRGGATYLRTNYSDYSNALANIPNANIGGAAFSGPSLCALANSGQSTSGRLTGGNTTCTVDATGRPLVKAPSFTSSLAVDYTLPVADGYEFGIGMNWQHTGKFYWEPTTYYENPAYDVVNGQISFGPEGDRWRVRVFGRNLTGTKYYAQINPSASGTGGIPGAPRTYGIALDVKFGGN